MRQNPDTDPFEELINHIAEVGRSPKGRFSSDATWQLLSRRLHRPRYRLTALRTFAAAASLILLIACGWWTYSYYSNLPLKISTLAEVRTIDLPDRSKVTLNRYTTLTCPRRFNGKRREVNLSGEAYFEVSKDAAHPFIVHTSDMDVRVLGTHFNVNAYPDGQNIRTTLLEGKVEVKIPHSSLSAILLPGQRATLQLRKKELQKETLSDLSSAITWMDNLLIFRQTPLSEIAERLSQLYRKEIVISDEGLRNYRISAQFSTESSLEEILALLTDLGKFRYNIDNNRIIIQKLTR